MNSGAQSIRLATGTACSRTIETATTEELLVSLAKSVPGIAGAANWTRPRTLVWIWAPLDSVTSACALKWPVASRTASVAGSPATICEGITISAAGDGGSGGAPCAASFRGANTLTASDTTTNAIREILTLISQCARRLLLRRIGGRAQRPADYRERILRGFAVRAPVVPPPCMAGRRRAARRKYRRCSSFSKPAEFPVPSDRADNRFHLVSHDARARCWVFLIVPESRESAKGICGCDRRAIRSGGARCRPGFP